MGATAYHFVGETLRDGRPIPADGEWLTHDGPVVICEHGLHASRRPWHALRYAPGNTLCLVECDGIVTEHDDKLVCVQRRILKRIDAEPLLREFARAEARRVAHLWSAPDAVRQYLETGDESLRAAARDAARAAARDAARDAAWDAAWAAARAAAWDAAWDAARDAARDAASDASGERFDDMIREAFAEAKGVE